MAEAAGNAGADASKRAGGERSDADRLDLTEKQKETVKVEAVTEREFPVEKQSVGAIDFNEDMTLQVFAPYQGRIIRLFADVGDDVKEGRTLFTIDSPDLLQAESTLIAAAGVLEMTTRNLARLKQLYETRAVSQKDLEQAVSDQQTAEGNLGRRTQRANFWHYAPLFASGRSAMPFASSVRPTPRSTTLSQSGRLIRLWL